MELDEEKLDAFIRRYGGYDRPRLIERGYLADDPPPKGTAMLSWKHRSGAGERLLTKSKDVLFALLFGDESTNTRFDRVERELLTMTLPRFKAEALDFMQASTEVSALGTWRDPEHTADDTSADDVLLQVEYGEVASELIGNGIVRTLSLINSLEMNEQVVYARMVNVEQSTLIT